MNRHSFHAQSGVSLATFLFAGALLSGCGGGDADDLTSRLSLGTSAGIVSANNETGAPSFTASLTGQAEVPPVSTSASGSGVVTVNTLTGVMRATINTTGVAGTSAAIEQGPAGQVGPIVFPLTPTAPGSGIWSTEAVLSQTNLDALLAGNYYFNVRSAAHPQGEIRGQIIVQTSSSGAGSGSLPVTPAGTTGAIVPAAITGAAIGQPTVPVTQTGTTTGAVIGSSGATGQSTGTQTITGTGTVPTLTTGSVPTLTTSADIPVATTTTDPARVAVGLLR